MVVYRAVLDARSSRPSQVAGAVYLWATNDRPHVARCGLPRGEPARLRGVRRRRIGTPEALPLLHGAVGDRAGISPLPARRGDRDDQRRRELCGGMSRDAHTLHLALSASVAIPVG